VYCFAKENEMSAPQPHEHFAEKPDQVEGVRVVTLNLWGRRGDWTERHSVLFSGLRDLQPDLVAFQESIVTDTYDQVTDLLGTDYSIAHHAHREPDGQGISIASRWPLRTVREVDLQVSSRTADFACTTLIAEVLAPNPVGPLIFVNHCPNWQSNFEFERERQAVLAARNVEELVGQRSVHVVLAGDFTAAPDTASVRFWRGLQSLGGMSVCYADAWERTHPGEPGHTFSPRNPLRSDRWLLDPGRRIDYIFVRCGNSSPTLDVADCALIFDQPLDGIWASDHFGLVADLAVLTKKHTSVA
jgi:endonuclease/exonuclease/phosphatase family metal-dependent hydrolase